MLSKGFFKTTKICPYTDAKEKVVSDWKTTKTDQDVETKGAENILKNPQGAAKMKIKKQQLFFQQKRIAYIVTYRNNVFRPALKKCSDLL